MKHLKELADRNTVHEQGMQDRLNVADKINATVKDLVLKTDAIRGYIFELHNSSNNLTGLPFAKFSMTYEFFAEGQRPVIHDYQNLSLSTLSSVIFEMYTQSYVIISTKDLDNDKYRPIQWFLSSRNADKVIFIPLKDTEGKIFALAGFDYKAPQADNNWTLDDMEKVFFPDCSRISGYLDFKHI